MGLIEAAAEGDRLRTLEALRDVLASSVLEADADKRASLAARLSDVLIQIESLAPPVAAKGDAVDEIAERRAARGAGTAKSSRQSAADKG